MSCALWAVFSQSAPPPPPPATISGTEVPAPRQRADPAPPHPASARHWSSPRTFHRSPPLPPLPNPRRDGRLSQPPDAALPGEEREGLPAGDQQSPADHGSGAPDAPGTAATPTAHDIGHRPCAGRNGDGDRGSTSWRRRRTDAPAARGARSTRHRRAHRRRDDRKRPRRAFDDHPPRNAARAEPPVVVCHVFPPKVHSSHVVGKAARSSPLPRRLIPPTWPRVWRGMPWRFRTRGPNSSGTSSGFLWIL